MLGTNPCALVKLPPKTRSEMRALGPDEARKFLANAAQSPWYMLFLLAMMTGLRPSEYLALKWSDVDFMQASLTVQRSVKWSSCQSGDWYFDELKTASSRCRIPLMPFIIAALKDYRRRQNEARLKAGADYQQLDLIFATGAGLPLIRMNIIQRHFTLLEKIGLPASIHLYDLRHTCATLLLSANENPKVVQERLGHSSIVMTMNTYSHVLPDMQEAVSAKLESILQAGKKAK